MGRYYKLIRIKSEYSVKNFPFDKINKQYIESEVDLGQVLDIKLYGRSYDPYLCFIYHDVDGEKKEFYPTFSSSEIYLEYNPYSEEKSKMRVQKRTSILKEEILGNDWALRPENVVATQGIDISGFREGN
uniref:Uncharacterized protein n=1 Tax=viral metagenome TaxID=1070528 RepID=A0A6C0JEE3_9ZZZZ